MKTVTVTFNGPSKSGKQAMGVLLAEMLRAAKFDVEMEETSYDESSASEVAATLARLNRDQTRVVVKFSSATSPSSEEQDDTSAW